MRIKKLHEWNLDYSQARKLQERFAGLVIQKALPDRISSVAGADVSMKPRGRRASAAIAVFSFPELAVVDVVTAEGTLGFPYIPGLLTFREGPVLLEAFRRLRLRPDVILFDGQGIAHSRGMGIASHMGLFLETPTVGCAKSPLVKPEREPGEKRGARSPIRREGSVVGAALRTRTGVRPVYVSPGHLADVPTSISLVLECCRGFRIPEPLRLAHRESGRILRGRAEP